MTPVASVVIPTRNRKELLRQSIQSCLDQTVPVEIIVVDDGSDDGTTEMMKSEFPQVIYKKFIGPNGPSYLRTQGCAMASCDILFPIDDDSILVSNKTIEQTLQEFIEPCVGSVAIPFINVRKDQTIYKMAPDVSQIFITHAFVGAAHALRKSVFLECGAYHPEFFYMGEEGDACIRMLNRGFVVRLGRADPIHHHESPLRSSYRATKYGRQNDILFVWYNTPFLRLPMRMLRATVGGMYFAFLGDYEGKVWWNVWGLLCGYGMILRHFPNRKPVSMNVDDLFRQLKIKGCIPLEQIRAKLPLRY